MKPHSHRYDQKREYVNVTNIEPNKRRSIFIDSMNKNGFTAFIKHTQNNQTYYVFTYEKSPSEG